MKNIFGLFAACLIAGNISSVFAEDLITVKVDSMANVSQAGAIESCGTAVHKNGVRPLLVTLKHDASYYTTLTAANDKWCVVFKRWTFTGKVDVTASTLTGETNSDPLSVDLK